MIIEKRAIGLVFKDLIGDNFVEHFLYYIYFEYKFTRNLGDLQCKEAKSHLYAILYLYYTEERFKKLILAVIATALKHKKSYIK